MSKHLKEENNAYLIGKITSKLLLIFFLTYSFSNSQITLNNFGVSDFIKTHSHYNNFTIIDFNNDGIKDLFLFGKQEKSFVIHKGLSDTTFSGPITKFFFYPIDDFKWLTKSNSGADYYLFISRKKRLIGLVSFTKSNSLQLLNTLETNSYPSSIKITDIDKDNINEALIYGNNFNGIMLVENNGYKLSSSPIYENSLIGDLAIVDFNNDDNDDIISIDLLNNSLKFLENLEENKFVENRELMFEETISELYTHHVNEDSFIDLVLPSKNGLKIMFGDSVFSYRTTKFIPVNTNLNTIEISDFNYDGNKDLIALNSDDDKIIFIPNYLYDKDLIEYYLNEPAIIKLSYGKIFALSKKGMIQTLGSSTKYKSFKFSIGGEPNKLFITGKYDSVNTRCFISDKNNNRINIIFGDSSGNIKNILNKQFLNPITDFIVSSNLDYIVGYSKGNRLIELIYTLPGNDQQYYFYTQYPVDRILPTENNNLLAVENFNNALFIEELKNIDGSIETDTLYQLDSLIISYEFTNDKNIFYWKKEKDKIALYNFHGNKSTKYFVVENSDSLIQIRCLAFSKSSESIISLVNSKSMNGVYITNGQKTEKYLAQLSKGVSIFNPNNICKSFRSISGSSYLFVYNIDNEMIYQLKINKDKKQLEMINTIEIGDINDYFVNEYLGKTYIVYSNNSNKCLGFRVLTYE